MEKFQVAHIREQGQNVILILVAEKVEHLSLQDKEQLLSQLQFCATNAGLAGTAALVWFYHNRVHSFGPQSWRAFLEGISVPWLLSNLNRSLSCG